MLSVEKNELIKKHLLKQIVNLPEDQKKSVSDKLISMTPEEMEEFLKENNLENLIQDNLDLPTRCIFCAIAKKEIFSYIIEENEEAIGVLEINPLSKGHIIVIPKNHLKKDKLNEKIKNFAKKLAEQIAKKFKPKEVKIIENEVLEHGALEIIPLYGNEKERKKATETELQELQKEILTKKEDKVEEPKKEEKIIIPKLKPRIP